MKTKAEIDAINQRLAREWWRGLGLELNTVELGDVIAYDVLRVLGGLWLNYAETQKARADGKQK